jgi:hypothetical protein
MNMLKNFGRMKTSLSPVADSAPGTVRHGEPKTGQGASGETGRI